MAKRDLFSSRTAAVLTMIGVSVGLGNVWRFPYMMGSHGGSAFLFIYLLFVVLFGIPAVMAEWALGRSTRSGPIGAFAVAFGKRWGSLVGIVLTTTVLIANSYYLVVVAMVVYSVWFSAVHGFDQNNLSAFASDGLGNGWLIAPLAIGLLGLGLAIAARGVRHGIQQVSRLFVPFFGLVVLYMIFHALTLPGAAARCADFLQPDFTALTATNVFAALGQAIFSLSLGGTFFVIYGSYLRANESIPSTAMLTALGDAGAALCAALFLVPAMLVFQLELDQGPGLVFETLPQLFIHMPGGRIVGTLFLLAFALMAFLSSLAALQVGVGGLTDLGRLKPPQAFLFVGAMESVLILVTSFRQEWIGPMDLVFGSGMQCLGCLLACLAVGWGLGKAIMRDQWFGETRNWIHQAIIFWLRWIVPAGILAVLILASDPGRALLEVLGF